MVSSISDRKRKGALSLHLDRCARARHGVYGDTQRPRGSRGAARARLREDSAKRRRPGGVRGPVERPPCMLQRPFRARRLARSHTAGARPNIDRPFFFILPINNRQPKKLFPHSLMNKFFLLPLSQKWCKWKHFIWPKIITRNTLFKIPPNPTVPT